MQNTTRKNGKKGVHKTMNIIKTAIPGILDIPRTEKEYNQLLSMYEELLDMGANKRNHKQNNLYNIVSLLLKEYDKEYTFGDADGVDVLKYLMEQNDLKQNDLLDVFDSQATVSNVLNRNRGLTLSHVRKLSRRFNLSADTFI